MDLESLKGKNFPDFETNLPVIGENTEVGSVIGQLVIIDPDKDEDISVIVLGKMISVDAPTCLTLTRV